VFSVTLCSLSRHSAQMRVVSSMLLLPASSDSSGNHWQDLIARNDLILLQMTSPCRKHCGWSDIALGLGFEAVYVHFIQERAKDRHRSVMSVLLRCMRPYVCVYRLLDS
jgi:hypothetical protein